MTTVEIKKNAGLKSIVTRQSLSPRNPSSRTADPCKPARDDQADEFEMTFSSRYEW